VGVQISRVAGGKVAKNGILDCGRVAFGGSLLIFEQSRYPVNSKVVRPACNISLAVPGVYKKKLLGICTGGQLPPTFCTGGL